MIETGKRTHALRTKATALPNILLPSEQSENRVNLGSTPPRPRNVLYLLLFMIVGVFVAQGIASVNFTFATMISINILLAIAFALLWPDDKNTL